VHSSRTEQVFVVRVDADADGERIPTTQNGVMAGRTRDILVSAQALGEVQIATKLCQRIMDRRQASPQTGVPGQSMRANDGLQLGIERIDRSTVATRRQSCVLAARPWRGSRLRAGSRPSPYQTGWDCEGNENRETEGKSAHGDEATREREREVFEKTPLPKYAT
jgi:hypothetical protein